MPDSKLGSEYKAARQAMQRFSLEQSAEESVNLDAETESAGRQACPSCGTANRKENNFCASCGATLLKSPRQAQIGAAPLSLPPAHEAPGDHHYHHHYHHHYFSSADGMEPPVLAAKSYACAPPWAVRR